MCGKMGDGRGTSVGTVSLQKLGADEAMDQSKPLHPPLVAPQEAALSWASMTWRPVLCSGLSHGFMGIRVIAHVGTGFADHVLHLGRIGNLRREENCSSELTCLLEDSLGLHSMSFHGSLL